jgi:hypothetical protein
MYQQDNTMFLVLQVEVCVKGALLLLVLGLLKGIINVSGLLATCCIWKSLHLLQYVRGGDAAWQILHASLECTTRCHALVALSHASSDVCKCP